MIFRSVPKKLHCRELPHHPILSKRDNRYQNFQNNCCITSLDIGTQDIKSLPSRVIKSNNVGAGFGERWVATLKPSSSAGNNFSIWSGSAKFLLLFVPNFDETNVPKFYIKTRTRFYCILASYMMYSPVKSHSICIGVQNITSQMPGVNVGLVNSKLAPLPVNRSKLRLHFSSEDLNAANLVPSLKWLHFSMFPWFAVYFSGRTCCPIDYDVGFLVGSYKYNYAAIIRNTGFTDGIGLVVDR